MSPKMQPNGHPFCSTVNVKWRLPGPLSSPKNQVTAGSAARSRPELTSITEIHQPFQGVFAAHGIPNWSTNPWPADEAGGPPAVVRRPSAGDELAARQLPSAACRPGRRLPRGGDPRVTLPAPAPGHGGESQGAGLPDAVEHRRVVLRGLAAGELHAPQPVRPVLGQLVAVEGGDPDEVGKALEVGANLRQVGPVTVDAGAGVHVHAPL